MPYARQEDANANARRRYAADPAYRSAVLERTKKDKIPRNTANALARSERNAWRAENIERIAALRRARRYGLTLADLAGLEKRAGGRCEICREPFVLFRNHAKPHIDHCHRTGKVRGLLCGRCNIGLGALGDDADRLRAAVAYLVHPPDLLPDPDAWPEKRKGGRPRQTRIHD